MSVKILRKIGILDVAIDIKIEFDGKEVELEMPSPEAKLSIKEQETKKMGTDVKKVDFIKITV